MAVSSICYATKLITRGSNIYSYHLINKRYYADLPKRFYKHVSVTNINGNYEINLDNRKLKTPLGNVFKVPNEALAIAVATEWDTQEQKILIPHMHLTGLSSTAIDNPSKNTKESHCDSIVELINSDTLCYRATDPQDLMKYQEEKWDPVLRWFEERYKVKVNVSHDVSTVMISNHDCNVLKRYLMSYNEWSLLGFQFAAESLKSFILTCAALNCYLDVSSCVKLSNLELEYQIKHWGTVEWAHDIELQQTKARVAAGILFAYLNSESNQFLQKASNLKYKII